MSPEELTAKLTKALVNLCQVLGRDRMEEFINGLTPEVFSDPKLFEELFERTIGQDSGEYGMGGDWWKASLTAEENDDV